MEHVSVDGNVVFLDETIERIVARCTQMKVDRIVGQSSSTLADILARRRHVYERSYDIRVSVDGMGVEEVVRRVVERLDIAADQRFVSTRGVGGDAAGGLTFFDVVRRGLAADGGLFVPNAFDRFTRNELHRFAALPYTERVLRVLEKFPLSSLHPSELLAMIEAAYSSFHSASVLPVVHLEGNQYLYQTFYGPTASFKDLSLQLTPKIVTAATKHAAAQQSAAQPANDAIALLVATSGDTGCAALHGFGAEGCFVVVLYPANGVSPVQRLQMQCFGSPNRTAVIGVDADFDWCQSLVKSMLNDTKLCAEWSAALPSKQRLTLSSGNSMNWSRLFPQIAFTVSAYADLVRKKVIGVGDPIDVAIPTGNFGHILGATIAQRMGVPIRQLICASNSNHILSDFIRTGVYDLRNRAFLQTMSPSIDILVSSNVERYLYWLTAGNAAAVKHWFGAALPAQRYFALSERDKRLMQSQLRAGWCSEEDTARTIAATFKRNGIILDPHTAVAKHVADQYSSASAPMLIASTAHFAKFPAAILKTLRPNDASAIERMNLKSMLSELQTLGGTANWMHPSIMQLPDRRVIHSDVLPADPAAIKQRIRSLFAAAQS